MKRAALLRLWHLLWPQVPIALFIIVAGAINLWSGLHAQMFMHVVSGRLAEISGQTSVAVLGSGAQAVFGAGLILTGFGLLWRVRVAWAFAILLLLITIGINLAKGHLGITLIIPAIVLLLLFWLQRYFSRRTLLGSSLLSLVSVFAVIAYGTLGIYLLGQQFEPHITTLLTALYFLVETLSTTGYGDFAPVTQLAQGFMITVWVFGLGVFGAAIVSILGPALADHLNRFFSPGGQRRMEENHVIVVGSGLTASNTVHELARREVGFVQVVAEDCEAPLPDHPVVHGDTSDDTILRKAGIAKARMLIAAEDNDGDNAFISLAAKDANPQLRVLIVASSQRSIRRLKLAHADLVFAPSEVGSRLLANLVEGQQLPPQFADLLEEVAANNTPTNG